MIPPQFFYQLVVLGLLGWFVMLHDAWPSRCVASPHQPAKPIMPPRKRSSDPQPFPGLTRTPPCAACEQAHAYAPQPPGCPPPRIVPTRGRPRQVDTSQHGCPYPDCASQGWVGLGNLCANGHPSGGPRRQLHGTSCGGSFQETQGVVHQVVQLLAPDCLPLFLTDGYKEYATALLTHCGQWVQPPRRQATGPTPKPR